MIHTKTDTKGHIKVALFFALIGLEIGLTVLSGENIVYNFLTVTLTAYATYRLDDIFLLIFPKKKPKKKEP